MSKKTSKLRISPATTNAITEATHPRHRYQGMVRIQLPWVEIEHDRLSLTGVDALDPETDEGHWQQSEVSAASDGKVHACQSNRADRELDQLAGSGPADRVGK